MSFDILSIPMRSFLSSTRARFAILLSLFCLLRFCDAAWGQPLYGVWPDPNSTSDCDYNDVKGALATIRRTAPDGEAIFKAIEAAHKLCLVTPVEGSWKQAYTSRSMDVTWPFHPNNGRFEEGVCADPLASLYHEIYHCYQELTKPGKYFTETHPVPGYPDRSKIVELREAERDDTVNHENVYRKQLHLCMRTQYHGAVLEGEVSGCPDPKKENCNNYPTTCPTICCWIYHEEVPGEPWKACTRDKMTPKACDNLTDSTHSPGSTLSPCNPDTPPC
jgi:hypothetical protein